MRVALAALLLSRPDILLLDEPTNHLDTESMEWLENWLKDFRGTIIAVSTTADFWIRWSPPSRSLSGQDQPLFLRLRKVP